MADQKKTVDLDFTPIEDKDFEPITMDSATKAAGTLGGGRGMSPPSIGRGGGRAGKPTINPYPQTGTDRPLHENSDSVIDFLRPFVSSGVGGLAAAGTSLIPGIGQSGVAQLGADTQGYAIADALMQQLKSQQRRPATFGEALMEGEKEAAINAVTGKIIGGLFKGAKAFTLADQPEIYNFKPTTSQALEAFGWHALGTSAKLLEDVGAPSAKAAALDRAGGAGFTQALALANKMNGRMYTTNQAPEKIATKLRSVLGDALEEQPAATLAGEAGKVYRPIKEATDLLDAGSNVFDSLDDVLKDKDKLQKVLTAGALTGNAGGNVRQDLQAYHFMRTVNSATTKDATGQIRLDPEKLAKTFNDPKTQTVMKDLYGSRNFDNVKEFMKNVATTQAPVLNTKIVRFVPGGFAIGLGFMRGDFSGVGTALGASTALYIPAHLMGNLLTRESTAKILGNLAKGVSLDEGKQLAARTLTNSLQGASIALINQDGKKTWGHLEKQEDGTTKFVKDF